MARFDSEAMLTFPIASFAFNLQPYIFPVFFPTKETSLGDTVKRLMFDEVRAPVRIT
jgi:amino acid permease